MSDVVRVYVCVHNNLDLPFCQQPGDLVLISVVVQEGGKDTVSVLSLPRGDNFNVPSKVKIIVFHGRS